MGVASVLIPTSVTVALRCPQCGQLELTELSRFTLKHGDPQRIQCTCGRHLLTVGVRRRQVWVQVPCYLCDGTHIRHFAPERFWDPSLKQIACAETDLQLGVLGGEEAVVSYVRPGLSDLERIMDDGAFDDFFDDPAIMYQVLSQVQELNADGHLQCRCGSREIGVDIFPDRLELTCSACGRQRSVPAASEQDLDMLLCATHLEIGGDRSPQRSRRKK